MSKNTSQSLACHWHYILINPEVCIYVSFIILCECDAMSHLLVFNDSSARLSVSQNLISLKTKSKRQGLLPQFRVCFSTYELELHWRLYIKLDSKENLKFWFWSSFPTSGYQHHGRTHVTCQPQPWQKSKFTHFQRLQLVIFHFNTNTTGTLLVLDPFCRWWATKCIKHLCCLCMTTQYWHTDDRTYTELTAVS